MVLWFSYHDYHARIQEISSGGGGGVQVSLTKKALTTFFFSPQLIFTEVKWSISKKSIIFQGFRGGPRFSRGGGPTFSSCLFPIETNITCDFPGGPGPPDPPPSGSALDYHEAHE